MPTPSATLISPGLDGTIVLLRHGESAWVAEGRFQGQGDPPLSPTGIAQARLAAERIAAPTAVPALPVPAGLPVEIRHSPLARTGATAAEVARALSAATARGQGGTAEGVVTLPDPGFLEIGQGLWEGRLASEIEERWPDALAGWRSDPLTTWAPEGEALPVVDRRVRSSLRALMAQLADRGHGSLGLRSQVLGYGSEPGTEPWSLIVGHDGVFRVTLLALLDLPLTRFWTFPFALCGITVVEIRAGRARLRAHNLTEHLGSLETTARVVSEAERAESGAL